MGRFREDGFGGRLLIFSGKEGMGFTHQLFPAVRLSCPRKAPGYGLLDYISGIIKHVEFEELHGIIFVGHSSGRWHPGYVDALKLVIFGG